MRYISRILPCSDCWLLKHILRLCEEYCQADEDSLAVFYGCLLHLGQNALRHLGEDAGYGEDQSGWSIVCGMIEDRRTQFAAIRHADTARLAQGQAS